MKAPTLYVKARDANELENTRRKLNAEGLEYRIYDGRLGGYILEIEYRPDTNFFGMLPITHLTAPLHYSER